MYLIILHGGLLSIGTIREQRENKMIDEFVYKDEKKSINKMIMEAINFGIERETPKLQSDEKLQVNINDNNNDINILVSRVKKEENKLK